MSGLPIGPALGSLVNTVSEQVAGRERRFLLAGEGEVRLPAASADQLQLGAPSRQRLAQTRVYLLPGAPWVGVKENGAAWLAPWAQRLEHLGVGRAVPVPYTAGVSPVTAQLQIFTDGLFHTSDKRALARIEADLRAQPLAPGERVVLLGHSYGNVVGSRVAEQLQAKGVPVAGMVMLETHLPDIGQFVERTPAVRQVIEIENEPSRMQAAEGTDLRRLRFPELSHMEMVVRPPAELMNGVLRALAE